MPHFRPHPLGFIPAVLLAAFCAAEFARAIAQTLADTGKLLFQVGNQRCDGSSRSRHPATGRRGRLFRQAPKSRWSPDSYYPYGAARRVLAWFERAGPAAASSKLSRRRTR